MTTQSATAQSATALTGRITGRPIYPAAASIAPAADSVEGFAIRLFARMRSGDIDRSQLVPEYSAHLTDAAVHAMSRYLQTHDYEALPLSAQVVKTHQSGEQTFHVVKILFPRGDAASLMFAFNTAGKITGISLLGMAGD